MLSDGIDRSIREFMARPPFCYRSLSHSDLDTLRCAFTHDSFSNEARDVDPSFSVPSYERLEFLGDSVLEFLVCERVYRETDLEEGSMTDYKQSVVANRSISERILESGLGLDDMILVGHGHRDPHTGANRIEEGMRADVFEALIAAVYLLKGMDETRRIVREVLLEPTALPAEGRRIRGSQALRAEAPRRSSMLF